MPVRLRYDGYLIAGSLQHPSDDGGTKGGMVNVCVAGKQDDIDLRPSTEVKFLLRCRKKIR